MATAPKPVFREAAAVDPVTVEVIRGAMETVAYEMATHVSLTACSPCPGERSDPLHPVDRSASRSPPVQRLRVSTK